MTKNSSFGRPSIGAFGLLHAEKSAKPALMSTYILVIGIIGPPAMRRSTRRDDRAISGMYQSSQERRHRMRHGGRGGGCAGASRPRRASYSRDDADLDPLFGVEQLLVLLEG